MAYFPPIGSVVAFQNDPTKLVGVTYQAAGSVLAVSGSFTAPANQSVSGTVGLEGIVSTTNSTTATLAFDAIFTGTGEDVIDFGSITLIARADVDSGTNGLSIQFSPDNTNWDYTETYSVTGGTTRTVIITPRARYYRVVYTNGGQGQTSFRLQSILHPSHKLPLGTGQSAAVPINDNGGAISIDDGGGSITVDVGGSVSVTQNTSPWVINVPTPSYIAYQLAGSVLAVSGSFTAPPNQSVSGTIQAELLSTNVSIITVGGSTGSSSVTAYQGGAWTTSVVGGVSILGGAAIALLRDQSGNGLAQLTPGDAISAAPTTALGTTALNLVYNQATSQWERLRGTSSIGALVSTGASSVITVQGGTWIPSAIGYLIRNDALASTLGADGTYGPGSRDSAGRTVIKPFAADETTFTYTGSVVSGSVTLIAASAIGKRNYITDFWVANTGSVSTLITFQDGSTSVVGYTIAPGTSGSNSPGISIPLKTNPSQDLAFKAETSTSVLYMTVKGYIAP